MHVMMPLPSQPTFPQAQLLLHELNHRIGNEFCCAISVVSLAAARSSSKEVKAALTDVAEVLHHYAEIHHALQMPEHGIRTDAAAYLRKLCLSMRRSKLNQMKIDLVLGPSCMAAIGSMLATGDDCVRAHNKCGAACI